MIANARHKLLRASDVLTAIGPLAKSRRFSFSQWGEDILLAELHPQSSGYFIDVGAFHPWRMSNTFKLYLRGWSGITIDPNPDAAAAFRLRRRRDIHLPIGVASTSESLTYYRFANSILNSFDPVHASAFADQRIDPPLEIECRPLSAIVAEYCPGQQIDLLSVDCEGLDFDVLTSLDWATTRPSVIVVEDFPQFNAHRKREEDGPIRVLLHDLGYQLVAQGGLSFIYVSEQAVADAPRSSGFRLDLAQEIWQEVEGVTADAGG